METKGNTAGASLRELGLLFLRLGATAFGGPAAHIAVIEVEVVQRRRWLSREQFLDLLGATNLIPGPNSTEVAIHIGHQQRGWPGLVIAGSAFILPAVIIVTICAWAYVRWGKLPQVASLLYGVKPVIIVIVLQALFRLARSALKTKLLIIISVIGIGLSFLRINELIVLFGGGFIAATVLWTRKPLKLNPLVFPGSLGSLLSFSAGVSAAPGLLPLFLFFLKVGSVLFGSGYVLLAFLRGDLVERWHWLTNSQLLDALAIGQITPGPVFTTATFIGYVLAGLPGALIATLGIFLPAFFFVAIINPLVPRVRNSSVASGALDGVNAASLGLMAAVAVQLGAAALVDAFAIALALVTAILLFRFHVNSTWLIGGAAAAGIAKATIGI